MSKFKKGDFVRHKYCQDIGGVVSEIVQRGGYTGTALFLEGNPYTAWNEDVFELVEENKDNFIVVVETSSIDILQKKHNSSFLQETIDEAVKEISESLKEGQNIVLKETMGILIIGEIIVPDKLGSIRFYETVSDSKREFVDVKEYLDGAS